MLAGPPQGAATRSVEELHAALRVREKAGPALARLQQLLAEWRELAFGLEGSPDGSLDGPLDGDLVLASTLVLTTFVDRAEVAEELQMHLQVLRELVPAEEPWPEPLALALGHGWTALAVSGAGPATEAERLEPLRFALRVVGAIPASERRDSLGCALAMEVHRRLHEAGRGAEATDVLEAALARFRDEHELRPYLLCRLADERRVQSDWRAWGHIEEAERARARLAALQPTLDLSSLDRNLAGVRLQLELACGLLDQAIASLQRERAAGASDPESRLGLLLDEAGVALASAQAPLLSQALGRLDAALADEELFADQPAYRAQVRARRAALEDMLEDVTKAAEPRADAGLLAAASDPALDASHRAELVLRLARRAMRRSELELAGERLALAPREGVAPELEATLDATRALLALARGDGREALAEHARRVQAHYERHLENKRASPARDGGFGFLSWRNRRILLGAHIELCMALQGEPAAASAVAIDELLREQALSSLARRLDCKPGDLASVQAELLGPDVGLLLYLPGGTGLHLFCVDAGGVEHFPLPWSYELESLPRALQTGLQDSPARLTEKARAEDLAELEGLAAELAERLLPEGARKRIARWRGLYVAGADLVGGVPFECLPLGGEALGLRSAVCSLPSLPVGLELARRARAAAPTGGDGLELLLVAAPEHDASLGVRLPFSASIEGDLSTGFARRRVLSGREASAEGLLGALAQRTPSVLELVIHGTNGKLRELSGGLVLAPCKSLPDGVLWCEDLFAREFRSPPVVVLSTCGSARGPRRTGDDGQAQLGGAFLARGALCTLQAAGEIAFEPTVMLLKAFGLRLGEGKSPAEALRLARKELARDERFRHPFYLQSLRAVGLGLEPIR